MNATVVTHPDGVVSTETRDVLGRTVKITDNIKDGKPVRDTSVPLRHVRTLTLPRWR